MFGDVGCRVLRSRCFVFWSSWSGGRVLLLCGMPSVEVSVLFLSRVIGSFGFVGDCVYSFEFGFFLVVVRVVVLGVCDVWGRVVFVVCGTHVV